MAVSFSDLYNAKIGGINVGGLNNSGTQKAKWDDAYAGALQDYERLMGGGGGSIAQPKAVSTPRTIRSTSLPPTMSGATKEFGKVVPGGTVTSPTPTEIPMPTYDTGRVESLAQRFAAPGIRNLRSAMQDVQGGVYENPNVKSMTVREALQGYGQGLENVMAGALKEGAGVYGQEFAPQVSAALQGRSIASSERMHGQSIASAQSMQDKSLASNERINRMNNDFRAWLANV